MSAARWRQALVSLYADGEPRWQVEAHRPIAAALADGLDIGPADLVLDIAAGTGAAARRAAAHGATTVAVDLSVAQARAGSADGGAVRWAVADAEALPFRDAMFSRVVSNLGLVYVADPRQCLRELRRVLTPAGRAGFSAHAPGGFDTAAAALVNHHLFAGDPAPVDAARWGSPQALRWWLADWPCELAVRPLTRHEQHASIEAFWAFSVAARRHVGRLAATLDPGRLAAFRREYCELARAHAEPGTGLRVRHDYVLVTVVAIPSAKSGPTPVAYDYGSP